MNKWLGLTLSEQEDTVIVISEFSLKNRFIFLGFEINNNEQKELENLKTLNEAVSSRQMYKIFGQIKQKCFKTT